MGYYMLDRPAVFGACIVGGVSYPCSTWIDFIYMDWGMKMGKIVESLNRLETKVSP